MSIESTGAQECRVKHIRSVGCRHDNDRLGLLETVHFTQNLIQRLLALIVSTAETRAAVTSDELRSRLADPPVGPGVRGRQGSSGPACRE